MIISISILKEEGNQLDQTSDIKEKIEQLRADLNLIGLECGTLSEVVLNKSREVDILINEYMRNNKTTRS